METGRISKPSGRYNEWCEREPLVCADNAKSFQAATIEARRDLTPTEKAVLKLNCITGCMGVEFVAFSNVKIGKIVELPNNVFLVPCFLNSTEGLVVTDPLVHFSMKMESESRFVYDGWIPIESMDNNNIKRAIRNIDEALSIFALISRDSFDWEMKYKSASASNKSTAYYAQEHIDYLEEISRHISCLKPEDQSALYRSIAWLSQSTKMAEPSARFLLCILAFESLATHIERNANGDSPFFELCSDKLTKSHRREKRAKCIKETLENEDLFNPDPAAEIQKANIKAIMNAYFNCVVPIKPTLMKHIEGLFGEGSEMLNTFFIEKVDGYSLYDIRNEIAHGNIDTISDAQTQYISKRIYSAEVLVQRYIREVIRRALHYELKSSTMQASISMDMQNCVISNRSMYKGPTHMALLYSR